MDKVKIQYLGKMPEYLEDFPEGCNRSVKGSVHLVPKVMKIVSRDEYLHIKETKPELAKMIRLIDERKAVVKEVKKPKVEVKTETEEKPKTDEKKPVSKKMGSSFKSGNNKK